MMISIYRSDVQETLQRKAIPRTRIEREAKIDRYGSCLINSETLYETLK